MGPTCRIRGRFWRVLAPRWAHRPLCGDGAAARGGRWNLPGMPALYMSESFVTAVAEYEQDLGIRPGTLCAYEVDVDGIVDLLDPAVREAWAVAAEVPLSAWKHVALVLRQQPPTWGVAGRLVQDGAAGSRVPSARQSGGVNLVLWRWNDDPGRQVAALDPLGDLPRDQQSWPS